MGNKKNKREAKRLLKEYGFSTKFMPCGAKRGFGFIPKMIVDVLSLRQGDLVYEHRDNMNHRVKGFMAHVTPNNQVVLYHLVYEDNIIGSDAFEIHAARKNVETFEPTGTKQILHSGQYFDLKTR